MTTTTAFRPLLVQHGTTLASSSVVNDDFEVDIGGQTGTQSFAKTSLETYFQIYNFELVFDSERGLPSGNPVFYTSTAESLYFNWAFKTTLSSLPSGVTIVYYSNLSQTTVDIGDTLTAPQNIEEFTDASSVAGVLSLNENGVTYDFSYNLDLNEVIFTTPGGQKQTIMNITRNARWTGFLALGFFETTGSFIRFEPEEFDRGSVAGQHIPIHTGWENRPATLGRPIPDMRSGTPSFAQDLQEDGFVNGIWTSSRNWDPDDPRNIRPVEFPPDEGLKDDDVPV